MFDIGWSEMAVILMLALIIIGPRDLPRVARTIGQWVRKGRALAREFQTSLEEMARESELDQVKKEIEKVGRTDFKKSLENTIDPKGELTSAFDVASGSAAKPALTDAAARNKTLPPAATAASGNGADPTPVADGAAEPAAAPATKPAATKAKTSTKTSTAKTSTAKTARTTAAKKPKAKPAAATKSGSAGKPPAKPAAAKTTAGDKAGRGDQVAMTAKPG